jgi:rod shape-determining protein MreC
MKRISPRIWQLGIVSLVIVGVVILALGGFFQPVIRTVSIPLVSAQRWFNTRYMAVYEFVTFPRDMASIRDRNAELEAQIAQLQGENIQLQQQLAEANVLYALLDFARSRPENKYVAAAVIGRDPSPLLHYVIIDKGSDDGLRHGMPVVTQQGLVGRVDAVTARAARIQLISDPAAVVNISLANAKVDAQLIGSLTGDLSLSMIPQDAIVEIDDLVLTSGLGGSYPANVVVGKVVSVRKLETDLFQSAGVQPIVDFSNLQAVLVITNFKPVDIVPLIPTPIP